MQFKIKHNHMLPRTNAKRLNYSAKTNFYLSFTSFFNSSFSILCFSSILSFSCSFACNFFFTAIICSNLCKVTSCQCRTCSSWLQFLVISFSRVSATNAISSVPMLDSSFYQSSLHSFSPVDSRHCKIFISVVSVFCHLQASF